MSIIEYKYNIGDKVRVKPFEELVRISTGSIRYITYASKRRISMYASRDDITIAGKTSALGCPGYRLTYPGSGLTDDYHIEQFIFTEGMLELTDSYSIDNDLFAAANDADIIAFLKFQ